MATKWERLTDPDTGDTFFNNSETGESSWDIPDELKALEEQQGGEEVAIWHQMTDDDSGDTYYFNSETGESIWDKPEGNVQIVLVEEQEETAAAEEVEVAEEEVVEEPAEEVVEEPVEEVVEEEVVEEPVEEVAEEEVVEEPVEEVAEEEVVEEPAEEVVEEPVEEVAEEEVVEEPVEEVAEPEVEAVEPPAPPKTESETPKAPKAIASVPLDSLNPMEAALKAMESLNENPDEEVVARPNRVRGKRRVSCVQPTRAPSDRGELSGMDKEISARRMAKYDKDQERRAKEWIEELIDETIPEPFFQSLKSGEILCQLVNAIKPGAIKKIHHSRLPFHQMENITKTLTAAREIGVKESDMCSTIDLYEERDMLQVLTFIYALARAAEANVEGYTGPPLGPRLAKQNKRDGTKWRRWSTFSKLSMGSQPHMDRSHVKSGSSITFGFDSSGESQARGTVSKISMGSKGTMRREGLSNDSIGWASKCGSEQDKPAPDPTSP